jgi:hypothetical protein
MHGIGLEARGGEVSVRRKLRANLPAPLLPVARLGSHAARQSTFRLLAALRLQQRVFGRAPDLVHPQLYTDKIRWRMLYDRRPLLEMCSDRLAVRHFVATRVGEQCLVPLLGVFDRPGDIDWGALSPPYVVKATHGCGWNIIVRHSEEVDPEAFERTLSSWLETNYYHVNWEWSYKRVPRRIIVERFIGLDGALPADFKFYCFDGEPRAISACYGRSSPEMTWTWRDLSWNVLTFADRSHPASLPARPPSRLGEMVEVARGLSQGFDHVRVDLYCAGDRVYFGELTTTQAAGGWPLTDAGEAWLGAFWHLPSRSAVRRGYAKKDKG